jgi:hypothetical protein
VPRDEEATRLLSGDLHPQDTSRVRRVKHERDVQPSVATSCLPPLS